MAVRREHGRASALFVSAPFYHQHRPAPGFHAVVESPLADALRAAMGTGLRARGSLLGRRGAAGHGKQWRGQHADEGGCDDKSCHDFVLHEARSAGKSYGEIVKRASGPQPEAPFRCQVFCALKAGAALRGDLNFTIASDLGRNVTRDRFRAPTVAESARIALPYRITICQNRGDTSAHTHESPGPTTAGASLFCPGETPLVPPNSPLSGCGSAPRRRAILQWWTWTKCAGRVRCAGLESSTKSGAHTSNRGDEIRCAKSRLPLRSRWPSQELRS